MIKKLVRCCRECSTPLVAAPAADSEAKKKSRSDTKFCSIACKNTWNNRRKNRGADLYDLWMAMRYSREDAKKFGVWKEMCRLSEKWHSEDTAARRVAYEKPKVVLARLMDAGRLPRGERLS